MLSVYVREALEANWSFFSSKGVYLVAWEFSHAALPYLAEQERRPPGLFVYPWPAPWASPDLPSGPFFWLAGAHVVRMCE